MISSDVISVRIGMLPEMKTTEPYSPRARANDRANPVRSAGITAGKITRQNVCQRVAPRLAAASSDSRSISSIAGCKVRTTNGSPMNVSAMMIPSGENAVLIPSGSRYCPIQPFFAYTAVRAIPDTAVGSANGKSTIASMNRLPGMVYRTSVQATINPNTALIVAATSAVPNVSLYEATTRGFQAACQKPLQPIVVLFITS